jgi:hypothetical protein
MLGGECDRLYDLISYHQMMEKFGIKHQVCQFKVRCWMGGAMHQLRDTVPKDDHWILDEIITLLMELPPVGSQRLFELWKQIPERHGSPRKSHSAFSQLRELLIHLSEYWLSY